jgi:hypothetical protein
MDKIKAIHCQRIKYSIGCNGNEKERFYMGSPTEDKNSQVSFLKTRLNMFLDVLDAIDPEDTDLEDIDRLISMLDDMESKCREFNNRETSESV